MGYFERPQWESGTGRATSSFSATRPKLVPGQVLSPDEIVVGGKYLRMYGTEISTIALTALTLPAPQGVYHQGLGMRVRYKFPNGFEIESVLSLSDAGVTPAPAGWHTTNRLLRASEVTQE